MHIKFFHKNHKLHAEMQTPNGVQEYEHIKEDFWRVIRDEDKDGNNRLLWPHTATRDRCRTIEALYRALETGYVS